MKKIILLLLLCLIAQPMWACKCDYYDPMTLLEYNLIGTAFKGTILRIETHPTEPDNWYKRVILRVKEPYKNAQVGQEIAVYTQPSGDDCTGFLMPESEHLIGTDVLINADVRFKKSTGCSAGRLCEYEPPRKPLGALNFVKRLAQHTGFINNHYPNGVLEAEGYLKNGIAEGEWSYYDKDGCLKETVQYKNGLRDGEGTSYAYDENKIFINYGKSTWEKGRMLKSVSFYADGTPTKSISEYNYLKISDEPMWYEDVFECRGESYYNNILIGKGYTKIVDGFSYAESWEYDIESGKLKQHTISDEKNDKITYSVYDKNEKLESQNSHPFKY
jgi:antitoxin component YwqK of YwqJK toxin-antitoxin module